MSAPWDDRRSAGSRVRGRVAMCCWTAVAVSRVLRRKQPTAYTATVRPRWHVRQDTHSGYSVVCDTRLKVILKGGVRPRSAALNGSRGRGRIGSSGRPARGDFSLGGQQDSGSVAVGRRRRVGARRGAFGVARGRSRFGVIGGPRRSVVPTKQAFAEGVASPRDRQRRFVPVRDLCRPGCCALRNRVYPERRTCVPALQSVGAGVLHAGSQDWLRRCERGIPPGPPGPGDGRQRQQGARFVCMCTRTDTVDQ